jgi:tRNA(fMet)-specific endonuclease VapC
MVCLDTDFMVALLRGDPQAAAKAKELDKRGTRVATTPVNAFELFLGAHRSERREENVTRVLELLSSLETLEYDLWASEKAGSIAADLWSRGEPVGARDSMIAGIAMRHGEAILTRNVRHFSRIFLLRYEEW